MNALFWLVIIVIAIVLIYKWSKSRGPREKFKTPPQTSQEMVDEELQSTPQRWQEKADIAFDDSTKTDGMYLVVDIETTGLPRNRDAEPENLKNWPHVVQIAWLLFDEEGKLIEMKDYILKQESKIPDDSIEIHGITDDIARTSGVFPKSAYSEFINALNRSTFLVAHNIEFEKPILECEFLRNGYDKQLLKKETICTMKKGTRFCRLPRHSGGYKYPTLEELFKQCCYPNVDSLRLAREYHRANEDVAITAKCFFKLKELNIIKV